MLDLSLWKDAQAVSSADRLTLWNIMKADFGVHEMKTHHKVFKLVSFFLQYPEQELFTALPDIKHEIADIDNSVVKTYLTSFITYLESEPFDQLCEKYVKTCDFHVLVTLILTYTVFKDSRRLE